MVQPTLTIPSSATLPADFNNSTRLPSHLHAQLLSSFCVGVMNPLCCDQSPAFKLVGTNPILIIVCCCRPLMSNNNERNICKQQMRLEGKERSRQTSHHFPLLSLPLALCLSRIPLCCTYLPSTLVSSHTNKHILTSKIK